MFRNDWFTRWAVWTYGQDIHLVHHLYPNVPHNKLGALHELLLHKSSVYRANVIEVHGTFRGKDDYPAIVDVMSEMDPCGEIEERPEVNPSDSRRRKDWGGGSRRRAAAGQL